LVGSDALVVFEARLSLLLPEQFASPEVMRQVIRRDLPKKMLAALGTWCHFMCPFGKGGKVGDPGRSPNIIGRLSENYRIAN